MTIRVVDRQIAAGYINKVLSARSCARSLAVSLWVPCFKTRPLGEPSVNYPPVRLRFKIPDSWVT